MNVTIWFLTSLMMYIFFLNYESLIYLMNGNLYQILYKYNIYKYVEYYLHIFLEHGFVCIYVFVAFQPTKNVYKKRSKYNYIFAKILLIYFFFFLFHSIINIKNNFPLNAFYLVIIIFHLSEFFLSFIHNKNNYNYYNFLVNPNYGYVYFFILTLIEYYTKIFLFAILYSCEKWINKRVLHNLLIFNYFFFKNYIENYGICNYTYPDKIVLTRWTNYSQKNIEIYSTFGKNIFLHNNNNKINDIQLTKNLLINKLSPFEKVRNIIFMISLSNKYKIIATNKYGTILNPIYRKINKKNTEKENYKYEMEKKNNIHSLPINIDDTILDRYQKCLFTNILNKPNKKMYNLTNSFFIKIILKYGDIFEKYDIPRQYNKKYTNYYLFIVLLSLLFSLMGLILRIFGLLHCSKNFCFYVLNADSLINKYIKNKHSLVTWGLYKYMRHPCYTGWFYYSLFLQLSLFNIFGFFLCFIVSWMYFYNTIKREEKFLIECYDEEYRKYKAQTPHIYIPFMKNL
ncbi:protein-S-isoprenylcysteine O-methyltransferase, putative [Plasmodium berghei]|uniref:Protein-S-isoprenylcysteine O-methyltransferase n=2 Tax=Plasmodium berghei TaxID=5821 RepID=A0A509ATV1_PLABA|nr:protein-S-isoprenylcysteine O-methyltransferase, putative [Plasmodium berghei ANKA]CXJ26031.1 protein-S-isoprenylcysteine O-methyltransferase, putative [Plasmodium berghei]SCM26903.1 protein-S-isoprenylcysteine O-methyltransferase, putative [Plasmodium berghei]SCN28694.1 protein-S-isoprenylcysteine O-methyltransferase, putative [Plasmodium berghei]SCO62931.1 protein-S-isoprenylcysteine O-methyltransferase, putative [Plasmodium berghei]SCO64442.1 protein-S-isoprenylcysteine O-methyltransfera|eukprot:XP_034424340.1 protein-S-isoprenylcysteine O-methyltransferase, putative [Plasmodium berghei ANKA]